MRSCDLLGSNWKFCLPRCLHLGFKVVHPLGTSHAKAKVACDMSVVPANGVAFLCYQMHACAREAARQCTAKHLNHWEGPWDVS